MRARQEADGGALLRRNTALRSAPNTRIPSSARKCVVRSASSTPVSACATRPSASIWSSRVRSSPRSRRPLTAAATWSATACSSRSVSGDGAGHAASGPDTVSTPVTTDPNRIGTIAPGRCGRGRRGSGAASGPPSRSAVARASAAPRHRHLRIPLAQHVAHPVQPGLAAEGAEDHEPGQLLPGATRDHRTGGLGHGQRRLQPSFDRRVERAEGREIVRQGAECVAPRQGLPGGVRGGPDGVGREGLVGRVTGHDDSGTITRIAPGRPWP